MKELLREWIIAVVYAAGGIGWVFGSIQVVVDIALALDSGQMGDAFILFMLFPFAAMVPALANFFVLLPMVALPCLVWAWFITNGRS